VEGGDLLRVPVNTERLSSGLTKESTHGQAPANDETPGDADEAVSEASQTLRAVS
jgi:hypothetical protein